MTFKEYLFEYADDKNPPTEDELVDTPTKQDKKFNIDRSRYSKMSRKARNILSSTVDVERGRFGNPDGMKTAGGPTFSG